MAINLNTQYPGQTAGTSLDYPFGQGRNVATQNDDTGTPFEAGWFNDIQGLLQALLSGASLTPTGMPDTARNSQYLQALQAMFLSGTLGTANGNIPQIGTPGTTSAGSRSAVITRFGSNTNGTFAVFSNGLTLQAGRDTRLLSSGTNTLPVRYSTAALGAWMIRESSGLAATDISLQVALSSFNWVSNTTIFFYWFSIGY